MSLVKGKIKTMTRLVYWQDASDDERNNMKTLLACVLFLSLAAHAESDNCISFNEGEIILFALPGCQAYGHKGLYGHARWKNG